MLSDVSPVLHDMEISLLSDVYHDYSNMEVIIQGKNLFGFEGRSIKSFGGSSNETRRNFTGDGIYLGVTGNNYVDPSKISYTHDSENDETKVDCMLNWYGVGIDIPVKPGEVYRISMETESEEARIVFGFYDANGNYVSICVENNNKITIPNNVYWMLCILASSKVANGVDFKKVQLEKGGVASPFCKYVPPQVKIADSNGIVKGAKSVYPVTIIKTNSSTDIAVEYNRDINVAFNELRDAIVKLGGTV